MAISRRCVVAMILAVMTFVVAPMTALARSQSNTGLGSDLPIGVNPNASGTKWSGELTLSFVPESGGDTVTTEIFLRLRQGTRLEAFAGKVGGVSYPAGIEAAVRAYVGSTVIPDLYGCTADIDCPAWDLKSVDQFIEDFCDGSVPDCMLFMMMDVVMAVKE